MADPKYLRMTIDVACFEGSERIAKALLREGKGEFVGVGERMARDFMDKIKDGSIEIDDVRDVEDHT